MRTLLLFLFVLSVQSLAFAQWQKASRGKTKVDQKVIDSAKWRKKYYVIDRNLAYEDPLWGIKKLMGGNQRFIEGKTIKPRQDFSTIQQLASGQEPFAVIVGCSDSRVPNEMIFDQGLGDLFIIRTAGQVTAAASYGSIEFAILKLKTKLIVVLGHTECGAVAAALERPKDVPGHIVTLINAINPAVAQSIHLPGDHLENAIRQNVIQQVNELRDLDPILHQKHINGEILIVGAIYDIHNGKVEFLEETLGNLQPKSK